MALENQFWHLLCEESSDDLFPVGMRVLAVDDDQISLRILATRLRKCRYHVTATTQATEALNMLKENRNNFQLVISDVEMPGIDGFRLLELMGDEMDIPVVLVSIHSDRKLVMKGLVCGARDYLLKPIRQHELKNIWQHVVRPKINGYRNKPFGEYKAPPNIALEGSQEMNLEINANQEKTFVKRVRDQSEDEEDLQDIEALQDIEKYKLYLKRANQQSSKNPAFSSSYHGDFCTSSGSGGISTTSLPPTIPSLNMGGIGASTLIPPIQSESNKTVESNNPSLFPANQISREFTNQTSVRASPSCTDSLDVGICESSSLLEYNWCNENWQGVALLSRFPANSLPLCDAFDNNDELLPTIGNSPANFSSSKFCSY